MKQNRTVFVTRSQRLPPSQLNIRTPLGVPLELGLYLRDEKNAAVNVGGSLAQFVTFPRSRGGVHPYDVAVYDGVNGILKVTIPGNDLTDPLGYNVELYSRTANAVPGDPPLPDMLIAQGEMVTQGSAYSSSGPQSAISIPVVVGPPGPAGVQGAPGPVGEPGDPGTRGTMWFSGVGDPTIEHVEDYIYGDMYLDTSSGAVWKWVGGTWARI